MEGRSVDGGVRQGIPHFFSLVFSFLAFLDTGDEFTKEVQIRLLSGLINFETKHMALMAKMSFSISIAVDPDPHGSVLK